MAPIMATFISFTQGSFLSAEHSKGVKFETTQVNAFSIN